MGYSLKISSNEIDVLRINNSKKIDADYRATFDGKVFTVSMWIKTERASWNNWDEFAGKGNESAGAGWSLRSQRDNRIWLSEYATGGGALSSSGGVNVFDTGWHLITATYNEAAGHKMKIYLDGKLSQEVENTIPDASLYSLVFGARDDGSRGENILIDDLQYYDKELSATEIIDLYKTVPKINPLGLVTF